MREASKSTSFDMQVKTDVNSLSSTHRYPRMKFLERSMAGSSKNYDKILNSDLNDAIKIDRSSPEKIILKNEIKVHKDVDLQVTMDQLSFSKTPPNISHIFA